MDFRKGRRTVDNLFIIKTLVDKYLKDKRGKLYMAFIDLEKAYDCIELSLLWEKLLIKGVSKHMVGILVALYNEKSFCIRTEEGIVTREVYKKV